MAACSRDGCVALATSGGLCVLHAAGYFQHDGMSELRCGNCRIVIKKGEWYQRSGAELRHTKACKMHPDTAKELAAREAADAERHSA